MVSPHVRLSLERWARVFDSYPDPPYRPKRPAWPRPCVSNPSTSTGTFFTALFGGVLAEACVYSLKQDGLADRLVEGLRGAQVARQRKKQLSAGAAPSR